MRKGLFFYWIEIAMEPKPVISYSGDRDLIGTVMQKKLQTRFKQLQQDTLPKEEGPYSCFSSLCNGVAFISLSEFRGKPPNQALFQRPALHTYWTECFEADVYRKGERHQITHWLSEVEQLGESAVSAGYSKAECLIIYCVTAEVRARRHRTVPGITTNVEERIRTDFKNKAADIIQLRMASNEPSRLVESYNAFHARLNSMCLTKFRRDIEIEAELVAKQQGKRCDPDFFYNRIFLKKLNLAVAYEMTLQNKEALELYKEAITNLEEALSMFVGGASHPSWLDKLISAACTSWDYPKLVWSRLSWPYLHDIQQCSSPLLHIRTFFLARISHLLFLLERAWTVSELAISTLHCMAREIKMMGLQFPSGAFDCWAFMSCQEAINAIMTQISPDSLVEATPNLLLVRAELWHYALQKLHDIGGLCGLMPSSNKLNFDGVLVSQISSGVTPVSYEDHDPNDGMEDQGKKLIDILKDRKLFQREYLTLGEMVIGAFKHAGRRRMAFRVGTMMAQFHRDLGLVHEAEELLSDICKFYSEDQWTQLSTKAYSMLADCQMKLRLEDKYVNTMLLLASLPPYPGASHDPTIWLDKLTKIASKSPYQKILNWEPLIQLIKLNFTDDCQPPFALGDVVAMEMIIQYSGPKELESVFCMVQLQGTAPSTAPHSPDVPQSPVTPSPPTGGSSTPQQTSSLTSLGNLDDLDLESERFPPSRPIGQLSKFRSNTQLITHFSSADIAELEGGLGEESRHKGKSPDPVLSATRVSLCPGENRIRMEGKLLKADDFVPYKVSIKCGAFDFLHTVSTEIGHTLGITVHRPKLDVDISLEPQMGVFLAGFTEQCCLSINTGCESTVPEGASVRLVANSNIQISIDGVTMETKEGEDNESTTTTFVLPHIPPNSSHDTHMTITLPLLQLSESICDNTDHSKLKAWKHEIELYCDWLDPVHVAPLQLTTYDPLTLVPSEHSAGDHSFLKLLMINTSPLPLALRQPQLMAGIELTPLHGTLPMVLYPREDFSCLWLVKPDVPVIKDKKMASFSIKFQPLLSEDDAQSSQFQTLHYSFPVSNMQTVFEVVGKVDPMKQHPTVAKGRTAVLSYRVTNRADPTASTQTDYKLQYDITDDNKIWGFTDPTRGQFNAPPPGKRVLISVQVVPKEIGMVEIPSLTLSKLNSQTDNTSECVVLTSAQVYDLSKGQIVTVDALQLVT